MKRTAQGEANPGIEAPSDVPPDSEWSVVKSMMNAQRHTNASLEQYLLYLTHEEFNLNQEELEVCINEAIASQQRALEDLKTTRDLIKNSHE